MCDNLSASVGSCKPVIIGAVGQVPHDACDNVALLVVYLGVVVPEIELCEVGEYGGHVGVGFGGECA